MKWFAYFTFLMIFFGSIDGFCDETLPSEIDPLLASTFLGGNGNESGDAEQPDYSIALDNAGNVYLVGYTDSPDFPTTPGVYDENYNGNDKYDIVVAKFDSSLTTLLASTYFGGSHHDQAASIAIDENGYIYISGFTSSADFPTTDGAYHQTLAGGSDAFISIFTPDLTNLIASTYLGGSGNEKCRSLRIDNNKNIYVTGVSHSTNFPVTQNAYQQTYFGFGDIFISRFDSLLTTLTASTFLGESMGDWTYSLVLDGAGSLYITGGTMSNDFPVTENAYQANMAGFIDTYISKLDTALTTLIASTYLGGEGVDQGYSMVLSENGDVYLTGSTMSYDFPITPNAYQTEYLTGNEVYVSRLTNDLDSLLASTYLTGSVNEFGQSILIGPEGNVYVAGDTYSSDFPTTYGAYDRIFNEYSDMFISIFQPELDTLITSTFFGGSLDDWNQSLIFDSDHHIYIAGYTNSSDFPVTSNAYMTQHQAEQDLFISKLNRHLPPRRYDIDLDGIIDLADIWILMQSWKLETDSCPRCDVNRDHVIDVKDVQMVIDHFD